MIPDRGPDSIRGVPPDPSLCRCRCHSPGPDVVLIHRLPCCYPCGACGDMVSRGRIGEHIPHCRAVHDPHDVDQARWHDDGGR